MDFGCRPLAGTQPSDPNADDRPRAAAGRLSSVANRSSDKPVVGPCISRSVWLSHPQRPTAACQRRAASMGGKAPPRSHGDDRPLAGARPGRVRGQRRRGVQIWRRPPRLGGGDLKGVYGYLRSPLPISRVFVTRVPRKGIHMLRIRQLALAAALAAGCVGSASAQPFQGRLADNTPSATCTVSGATKCTSFFNPTLGITILNNWNIGTGTWSAAAAAGSAQALAASAGLAASSLPG